MKLCIVKGCTAAMVAAKYSSLEALAALVKDKRTDIYVVDNQVK